MRHRRLKDHTGRRFGKLVILDILERDTVQNDHLMLVRCDCGNVAKKRLKLMRSGRTASCGCLASAVLAERNTKHGLTRTHPRSYRTWKDMRARCNNPSNADYRNYGARGIAVCERWGDFANFVSDMGERPSGCTIDRINVSKGYEPGNCRWATSIEQARNKRNNRMIVLDGVEKTLQEWCNQFGIDHSKVRYRLSAGYSPEEAFSLGDKRLVR